MDKNLSKVSEDKEAFVLASMELAHYKLALNQPDECRKLIDDCEKVLDQLSGVEPVIHAGFYRVAADYYKVSSIRAIVNALLFNSKFMSNIFIIGQSKLCSILQDFIVVFGLYSRC